MAAKATARRRHPEPRRLATLVATVRSLEASAVDDALELLDVPMTNDLLARAARSNATHQPVIEALELIQRFAGAGDTTYYPLRETVPMHRGLRGDIV
jgi:hypothetical protein